MRIALVTHYFPGHGGGVEKVAASIAAELARRHAHRIDWYASDTDPAPVDAGGVRHHPMRAWNGIERLTGLPFPVWAPAALAALTTGIRAADVVHIHDFAYPSSLAAARLARGAGVPYVLTQHTGRVRPGNVVAAAAYALLSRTQGARTLRDATRVAFISATSRSHCEGLVGALPGFATIWNGLDAGAYSEVDSAARRRLRAARGLPLAGRIVLFAGRRVRKKGLGTVRTLAAALPETTFVIAGAGPVDPVRWQLANVRTLGFIPPADMPDLYRLADVLLLPSHSEGFPLVVQEALACGTAVLTTDEVAAACPPVGDLLRRCPVPANDAPGAWLPALRDLLGDAAWLDDRGRRAQRAAATWSWQHCGTEYHELMAAIVAAPQRRIAREDP